MFKRNSLKTSVEFGTKEMSGVVYDNFIKPEHREEVTFNEFHKEFLDVLDNQDKYKDMKSIEKAINELCENIIASKLKFPKGNPVIETKEEPKKRTRKSKKDKEIEEVQVVESNEEVIEVTPEETLEVPGETFEDEQEEFLTPEETEEDNF